MLKTIVIVLLVVLVAQCITGCTDHYNGPTDRLERVRTGVLNERVRIVDTLLHRREYGGSLYEYEIDGSRYIGRLTNESRSSFLTKK